MPVVSELKQILTDIIYDPSEEQMEEAKRYFNELFTEIWDDQWPENNFSKNPVFNLLEVILSSIPSNIIKHFVLQGHDVLLDEILGMSWRTKVIYDDGSEGLTLLEQLVYFKGPFGLIYIVCKDCKSLINDTYLSTFYRCDKCGWTDENHVTFDREE